MVVRIHSVASILGQLSHVDVHEVWSMKPPALLPGFLAILLVGPHFA